jgi:hypothetical protein
VGRRELVGALGAAWRDAALALPSTLARRRARAGDARGAESLVRAHRLPVWRCPP